jgi:hypothetical protein
MARVARDAPIGVDNDAAFRHLPGRPPPLRVTTEPPTGAYRRGVLNPTAKAPVSRLSKSPDEPADDLEPASPTPALVCPEPAAVMVMDAAPWGQARPPGACPATGRRIELRVAGHLSARARGAFGYDRVVCAGSETAIRGVLPDPSHVHEFLARCRSLGLQVISLRQIPQ